jgi:hypothetical protein
MDGLAPGNDGIKHAMEEIVEGQFGSGTTI